MRWLRRALSWLLDPILSRPNGMLDRILAITDAKVTEPFRRIEAAPEAAPRHRFRAPEVPMRELHVSGLGLAEVRRLVPVMPGLLRRMMRSGRYYRPELPTARTPASPELLQRVEAVARAHGALEVAYVEDVQPGEIFQGLALPAPGAIVFTVEMAPEPLAKAPSFDTFHEVAKGYRRLAEIAEAICDLLQAEGHAAYPGTALGGQTDYVALARRAGLGGIGFHGLLLTPAAGARVRIATVYTNLCDLPERGQAEHDWVQDFCSRCRQCVRSCPPQAIHAEPQPRLDGEGTACIDHPLCRDYFARAFGCAVCIKVCPFTTAGYAAVREGLAHVEPGRPSPVDDRRVRVAVVGAGAAGFYTTMRLLERTSQARVDLIERLPVPHGLVRYGVAPDHPEVRSKAFAFDQALSDPRVRLFANVPFGTAVRRADLQAHYDAVVYAVGAATSRSLGVPGEALQGSLDAPSFVGWYNGHPDHAGLAPPVDHPVAVVVGAGNVALDVVRMLASPAERLASTDMAPAAVAALRDSSVQTIHLLARRGPEGAAFTPRELRDLIELPGVEVTVDPADLSPQPPSPQGELAVAADREARRVQRNLQLLHSLPGASEGSPRVVVQLHFHTSVQHLDDDGSGRVGSVSVVRRDGVASIRCGLVIRAIGFRSVPLPGLPFDAHRHVLPSRDGRLVDEDGGLQPGEYVTGWVRRGPRGIIGTNKVDAEQVVECLLADLPPRPPPRPDALPALLAERGVRVVDEHDWDRLRREEHLRGSRCGQVAVRRTDRDDILASLQEAAPLAGGP